MSFETYEASHITPQYTLLEKLNAILGYIKKYRLTGRFYMYKGLYYADKVEYEKKKVIGIDDEIGEGDILVFQNRYLAVIGEVVDKNIIIDGATDIVTSVGHNYSHRILLRLFYKGIALGRFYVISISSISETVENSRSEAFKDKIGYLVLPFYDANGINRYFNIDSKVCTLLSFTRGFYGKVNDEGTAGVMMFRASNSETIPVVFNFTDSDKGGSEYKYYIYIENDEVQEI